MSHISVKFILINNNNKNYNKTQIITIPHHASPLNVSCITPAVTMTNCSYLNAAHLRRYMITN